MEEAEHYLRFLHEGIRDCAFATIDGDGPAHIEPTHCLRCGACAETCLHNAIVRSA